jgi:putative copper export protein
MEAGGWDIAALLAKALVYGSTLGACGTTAFLVYTRDLIDAAQCWRIGRIASRCALAAVGLSALRLLLLMGAMQSGIAGLADGGNATLLFNGAEGHAAVIRSAALGLLLVLLWRRQPLQALAAAAIAAASFAFTGHIHATLPRLLPVVLLVLHLLAAAFWFGALAPLRLIARGTAAQTARVVARFSRIALILVALLVGAGAGMLVLLLAQVGELWQSSYGRLVSIKLFAVAALLALAAYNRKRLTPAIARGDVLALGALRTSIGLECLCMTLVLLVTAAFTSLTGPGE